MGLALGGPGAVALVVYARTTSAPIDSVVRTWAVAWLAIAGLCVLVGVITRFFANAGLGPMAREIDRRGEWHGLFEATLFLLEEVGDSSPALAPVVIARADEAARVVTPPRPGWLPAWPIRRTAYFLLISLALAVLPGGADGRSFGIGARGEDAAATDPTRPTPVKSPRRQPTESQPEDVRPELSEVAQLTLVSDHDIYGLGDEITLTLRLTAVHAFPQQVPVEVVLALTDGLPSPDVGFGEGFHPVPLDLSWALPAAAGEKVTQSFPVKGTLEALHLHRPGLITAFAAARVRDDDAPVSSGLVSNQITFQIAERKEDQRLHKPTPFGQQSQREKQKPEKKPEPPEPGGANKKPELGDKEPIPDFKRVPSLVQPLVNDGPSTTKDVDVYDREPGGLPPAVPTPPPPPAATDRTFLRRVEVPQLRPDLTPVERRVLKGYFDRIRQGSAR